MHLSQASRLSFAPAENHAPSTIAQPSQPLLSSQGDERLPHSPVTLDGLSSWSGSDDDSNPPLAFNSQKEDLLSLDSQQVGLLARKSLKKLGSILCESSGQVKLLRSILNVYVQIDDRSEEEQKAKPWKTKRTRFAVLYHSATSALPEVCFDLRFLCYSSSDHSISRLHSFPTGQ